MKNQSKHPSEILTQVCTDEIRNYAQQAEAQGRLLHGQLQLIYEKNWFNLFVPALYGGLEMSLPDAMRLQESIAWADGSMGWTVALCSGANWFIGFLDERIRKSFFSEKNVCLAGSGAASGNAQLYPGGYILNGTWKYATGTPHATAFTVNCIIEKQGADNNTEQEIRSFLLKKEEVIILEDWNPIGMRATASHSFSVENLYVKSDRCFTISEETAILPAPIFHFPFTQFAVLTLTANLSGMAIHFMDTCKELFPERIRRHGYCAEKAGEMLEVLGRVTTKFDSERNLLYDAIDKSWENGVAAKEWSAAEMTLLDAQSRSVIKHARGAVNELYTYCGMNAADADSELNRVWRDFHTASLHSLFTFEKP